MVTHIQIITTTENREDSEKIANHLLDKKLAGCIQIIGPIISYYWWKGKKEKAEEFTCFIKTKKNLYNKVEKSIKEIHPYENPEIIATDIVYGSSLYLQWLDNETK